MRYRITVVRSDMLNERDFNMAQKNPVVGIYQTSQQAEVAVDKLIQAGFQGGDVSALHPGQSKLTGVRKQKTYAGSARNCRRRERHRTIRRNFGFVESSPRNQFEAHSKKALLKWAFHPIGQE